MGLQKPTRVGIACGRELPRHDHCALPLLLLVYPNHLICLYHIDHTVPSYLAVAAASLWTLGIALCWFSCTVMVPYEWVWIMGSCLLSSNLRPIHDELVERVRIPFFSPLLVSILVDPVRCGLSPSFVWCLLFSCVYTRIWKKSRRDSKAPKIMSSRNQLRVDRNQLIWMQKLESTFFR